MKQSIKKGILINAVGIWVVMMGILTFYNMNNDLSTPEMIGYVGAFLMEITWPLTFLIYYHIKNKKTSYVTNDMRRN